MLNRLARADRQAFRAVGCKPGALDGHHVPPRRKPWEAQSAFGIRQLRHGSTHQGERLEPDSRFADDRALRIRDRAKQRPGQDLC